MRCCVDTGGQSLVSSRCLVALTINKANETSRPLTSTSRREAVLALQRACLLLARQAASHLAAPPPPHPHRVGEACDARKAFVSRVWRWKIKTRSEVFQFVRLFVWKKKIGISEIVQRAAGEEVVAGSQAAPGGKHDMNAAREKRKKNMSCIVNLFIFPPQHGNVQSQFSMC